MDNAKHLAMVQEFERSKNGRRWEGFRKFILRAIYAGNSSKVLENAGMSIQKRKLQQLRELGDFFVFRGDCISSDFQRDLQGIRNLRQAKMAI